jgi:flagellar FliL protein
MPTKDKSKDSTDSPGAPAGPPKRSSMKWMIAGLVVLLLVGGAGAFAWFKFLAPHKADAKPAEVKGDQAAQPAKIGPIIDLDPFIVNLADPEPRFLKLTIKVEVDGLSAKAEIGERIPQIRDAVLILLSSKESQTIKPTAGKLQLRDEILQRINALLATGQAKNAYFTEFVVQ